MAQLQLAAVRAAGLLKKETVIRIGLFALVSLLFGGSASAAESAKTAGAVHGNPFAATFLWLAVILIAAKIGSLVEKFGQPSVLGELLAGVVLGNLALVGITLFEPIAASELIEFVAELGVVILLFQIGLESNVKRMLKVGARAGLVALVGVVVPFVFGTWIVGPWLMPDLSFNTYLFIGATLTATSVGLTARVFKDLGRIQSPEAQIVLGAAVIDDVLGLIILAVVSAIVSVGSVSAATIAVITLKALAFLVGAIVIGQFAAPRLGKLFSVIHTGVGMKLTLAICFGLVFAYLADFIGLAPIVGAFAAGLVLDPVHFKYFKDPKVIEDIREVTQKHNGRLREDMEKAIEPHAHRHIEDLIEPIGHFVVPVFFVLTGMAVRLDTLFDPSILLVALGVTVVAFIGKIVTGAVAGKVNKWVVGWGMVPRGEVGLIFAITGKALGVVNDQVYSVVVVMVILSTLLTPPILTFLLKRSSEKNKTLVSPGQAAI